MVSFELDVARQHLALSEKVHVTKTEELEQAKALVNRLQEQVMESRNDVEQAKEMVQRVERRLEVVEIDGTKDDGNRFPCIAAGVALAPTHPLFVHKKHTNQNGFPTNHRQALREIDPRGNSLDDVTTFDAARRQHYTTLLDKELFASKGLVPAKLRRSLRRHRRKLMRHSVPMESH